MSQGVNVSHLPKSLQREVLQGMIMLARINRRRELQKSMLPEAFDKLRRRAPLWALLLVLLSLLVTPAIATPAAVTCGPNNATGTLVAKGNGRGLVLTSPRVLDSRDHAYVRLDGHVYGANLLAVDRELDAAMLEIAEPPQAPQAETGWHLCAYRQEHFPRLRQFIDRFRPRCQPGFNCQAGQCTPPTFAQPAQSPVTQAAPWRPTGPPPQTSPPPDNRTPTRPDGTLVTQPPASSPPETHAAEMQAKSAELDQLQRTLAAERANTERALAQLAAQKATCAGARTSGPAVRAPLDLPAAAGDAARTAATGWGTKLLIGIGFPEAAAGLAATAGLWYAGRRVRRWWKGASTAPQKTTIDDSAAQAALARTKAKLDAALAQLEAIKKSHPQPADRSPLAPIVDRTANILVDSPSPEIEGEAYREAIRRIAPLLNNRSMTFSQFVAELEGTKALVLQGKQVVARTGPKTAWKQDSE